MTNECRTLLFVTPAKAGVQRERQRIAHHPAMDSGWSLPSTSIGGRNDEGLDQ
jgi:hypothetical protein